MSNWASRQKEALKAVTPEETNMNGMRRASGGGGEEIIAFYQFNPSKTGSTKARVLTPTSVVEGTYQGSFKDKTYGKYLHKVRTSEGLITLPSAGQLDKAILTVAEGAKVKVVYNGKKTIETGKFAGKPAHSFEVYADAFKDQE